MTEIQKLNDYLTSENIHIFYLTLNAEKATGIQDLVPNFHIVCGLDNDFFKMIEKENPTGHFCTEKLSKPINISNSYELLEIPEAVAFIKSFGQSITVIQTFKISPRLEILVNQMGWEMANSSSEMNKYFEDKFNLIEIATLSNCKIPPSEILEISKIYENSKENLTEKFESPFVLQFPRGHTGNGTFIVKEKNDLFEIQNKYPDSLIKKTSFVDGYTLNVNAVVDDKKVWVSGLNIQVNGVKELSKTDSVTCGNNYDYQYCLKDILFRTEDFQNDIIEICESLGKVMRNKGFLGFFGIDLILDTITQSIYLIEINARQTANVSYFNTVQSKISEIPLSIINLATFLKFDLAEDVEYSFRNTKPSTNGQLICRNYMKDGYTPTLDGEITTSTGLKYFGPSNFPMKIEEEVFRVQSETGICTNGVVKSEILEDLRNIKSSLNLIF